jgi:hypothetical protein
MRCPLNHDALKQDPAVWASLPFVGIQGDEVEMLELRNCPCGSTLAVVVNDGVHPLDAYPIPSLGGSL